MVDSKKKDLIEKIQSIEQLETAELKLLLIRFLIFNMQELCI